MSAAVPLFRQIARGRCTEFVQSIDDWLSTNEVGPEVPIDEVKRVGVGVFYFEGEPPCDQGAPRNPSTC
jgi:hypothetical protein